MLFPGRSRSAAAAGGRAACIVVIDARDVADVRSLVGQNGTVDPHLTMRATAGERADASESGKLHDGHESDPDLHRRRRYHFSLTGSCPVVYDSGVQRALCCLLVVGCAARTA